MGGCCFKQEDNSDLGSGYDETTPILQNNRGSGYRHVVSSNDFPTDGYSNGLTKNGHQTAVNRILATVSNQVIDISSMDNRGVDQGDYMERQRVYNLRVNLAANQSRHHFRQTLGSHTTAPSAVLAGDLPSPVQLLEINILLNSVTETLPAISVTQNEELVVQFGS